ncbi:PIN domain-containing protein [Leptolyngbya sp. FACHB-261]|uniref:type II toxin-antitoxin system tRNA(fMet)-specific endonuclease VapC n=1 Tax=Leptolyngbya sp. FACHB-261 TaxID=2692806 RepID=UPI001687FBDF|nr:PIN domain-containing protein [Leptolyngbya sp. FACHB-261]MBD2103120.1 type II toxin-antitoxin system VapC family toxin [Leptolyngbya sp. FACHB-261]
MTYLLDTNACIGYLTRRSSPIVQKLALLTPQDIVLCEIVKAELYYGAYKGSRLESNLAVLDEFFSRFVSLPFNQEAAQEYGRVRSHLEALGLPIGPLDLQIAAIALAHNVTLVTHNTREFSRISQLRIEDWEA